MAGRGEAAGMRDRSAGCATDREVVVVAAVLVVGLALLKYAGV